MKNLVFLWLVAAALTFEMSPSNAFAQDGVDQIGPSRLLSARLPDAAAAPFSYRVTYFNSQTGTTALRSASIISITNQSKESCTVDVQWLAGGGAVVCSTSLTVAAGVQLDFCTRPIPKGITVCNSICPGAGLTDHEGTAGVGAEDLAGQFNCPIAVSARTVYTASTTDAPISAITDAKIVRSGGFNNGD